MELNDYKGIINQLNRQFTLIKRSKEKYADLTFNVVREQDFQTPSNLEPNHISIVVRFNRASTNLNQTVLPFTMMVMGLSNEIDLSQDFLSDFVVAYNLSQDGTTTQLYMLPQVNNAFNEVTNSYRGLLSVEGTFLIGDNLVKVTSIEYWVKERDGVAAHYEKVPVIGFNDVCEANINPQPYYGNKGRTKSYGNFQTNSFSVITYPDGSLEFIKDIYKWKYDFTAKHSNDKWKIKINFSNVTIAPELEVVCRSANMNQPVGEPSSITILFGV